MAVFQRNTRIRAILALLLCLLMSLLVALVAYAEEPDDEEASTTTLTLLAETHETFSDNSSGLVFAVLADGTVQVGTGDNGSALIDANKADVKVPQSVNYGGRSYTVSAIGDNAFYGSKIKSITLPSSLILIGDRSFKFCRSLEKITIPDNVVSIGAYAFFCDNQLSEVAFGNDSKLKTLGNGCFAFGATNADHNEINGDSSSKLVSITLPSKLEKIPDYLFASAGSLESVFFESKTLDSIGDYAFDQCKALKSITIPELTGKMRIDYYAFNECTALEEVTFMGDMDYCPEAYTRGTEFAYCTGVQNIYYYGKRFYQTAYSGNHGLQTFNHDAQDWFTVYFYDSQASADKRSEPLGYVMVPSGTLKMDICAGLDDSRIHDSKNYTGGKGWRFADGSRSKDGITDMVAAIAVDKSDLTYGDITFSSDSNQFAYRGGNVDFGIEVVDAAGSIVPSSAYTLQVTDSSGSTIAADDISEPGTYRLIAKGMGDYKGSTPSVEVEVIDRSSEWKRIQGDNPLNAVRTINGSAFKSYSYAVGDQSDPDNKRAEYVLLVSENCDASALSAIALAGALDSAVIFTDPNELSTQASYDIKRVNASNVVIIGDDKTVSSSVEQSVKDILTVNNVYRISGSTPYEVARKIYTVGEGDILSADWSDVCYLASGARLDSSLGIASFAYSRKAPVFLTDPKNGLDFATLKTIYEGKFSEVIIVGSTDEVPVSIELALHGLPVTRLEGSSMVETSHAIARHFLDDNSDHAKSVVVVGEKESPIVVLASSVLAGKNGGMMIVAPQGSASSVISLLSGFSNLIDKGWVVGDASAITEADFNKLVAL